MWRKENLCCPACGEFKQLLVSERTRHPRPLEALICPQPVRELNHHACSQCKINVYIINRHIDPIAGRFGDVLACLTMGMGSPPGDGTQPVGTWAGGRE